MWLIAFIHLLTRSINFHVYNQHFVACKNTLFVDPWLTVNFLLPLPFTFYLFTFISFSNKLRQNNAIHLPSRSKQQLATTCFLDS
jgi:hypothetical protein